MGTRNRKPPRESISPGMKIGALTVIEPATEEPEKNFGTNIEFRFSDRGGKKWLCKCECGNEVLAFDRALRYGVMASCGCKHKTKDISWERFGRLVAMYRVTDSPDARVRWLFQCDCGNGIIGSLRDLTRSEVPSCGCYKAEMLKEKKSTHGMSHTLLYDVWVQMRNRCNNPNCKRYKDYGGREIKVCDRWNESFEAFYEDVHEGYKPGLQLDRIDNDGPYSPENTRWVTPKENCQNKRDTVFIDSIYGRLTLGELEKKTGITRGTLSMRKHRGIPDELITVKNCRGLVDLKPLFDGEGMWLTDWQEKRLYEAYDEVNEEERKNVPHG